LGVLRSEDCQRLQVDKAEFQARAQQLIDSQQQWRDKLPQVYAEESFAAVMDPEQQLYDGFIGDRDRRLCEQVRNSDPAQLAAQTWPFDDVRLPELLFRYRARNFPTTLNSEEQVRWHSFCRQRLTLGEFGAPNTLASFEADMATYLTKATDIQRRTLQAWVEHSHQLRQRYGLQNEGK